MSHPVPLPIHPWRRSVLRPATNAHSDKGYYELSGANLYALWHSRCRIGCLPCTVPSSSSFIVIRVRTVFEPSSHKG